MKDSEDLENHWIKGLVPPDSDGFVRETDFIFDDDDYFEGADLKDFLDLVDEDELAEEVTLMDTLSYRGEKTHIDSGTTGENNE